jgi:hypothetical protein
VRLLRKRRLPLLGKQQRARGPGIEFDERVARLERGDESEQERALAHLRTASQQRDRTRSEIALPDPSRVRAERFSRAVASRANGSGSAVFLFPPSRPGLTGRKKTCRRVFCISSLPLLELNRAARLSPIAPQTASGRQPAKQLTSAFPSSVSVMERLGVLSSCAGQRAIQPLPLLRTLSSRPSTTSTAETGSVSLIAGALRESTQVIRELRSRSLLGEPLELLGELRSHSEPLGCVLRTV